MMQFSLLILVTVFSMIVQKERNGAPTDMDLSGDNVPNLKD